MRILKRFIAVFIVVLTAFLFVSKAKAATQTLKPYGDKKDVFAYENVNEFEKYTYTQEILENYSVPNSGNYDKEIEKIIPLNCFVQKGTHIHIGVTYGFYVYTSRNGSDNKNVCEVFIFKITRHLNTNPAGVTSPLEGNVVNGMFTQFKPVISNNYYYNYNSSSSSYDIIAKKTNDNIAINYAFNLAYSKDVSSYRHNKDNWAGVHGSLSSELVDQLELDTLRYGYRMLIDLVSAIGKWMAITFAGSYGDALISLAKDIFLDSYDLIVSYKTEADETTIISNIVSLVTHAVSNSQKLTGQSINMEKVTDLTRILTDSIIKIINESNSSFPSFSSLFDTIYDTMEYFINANSIKGFSLSNVKMNYLSLAQDFGDFVLDGINFVISGLNLGRERFGTRSQVFFGKNWCGYSGQNDMQIKAIKNHRISIYNIFEYNPDNLPVDNYLEVYTKLQFRNGSDNYKKITSTYKMKLADGGENGRELNTPSTVNGTATTNNAIITNGKGSYDLYFTAQREGDYSFSASTNDGRYCGVTVVKVGTSSQTSYLMEGQRYKLTVNTSSIKGSVPISINIKCIGKLITKNTSFTCNKPGYYLVRINTTASDVSFILNSISYSQKYNFSSYSYTRTTYASFTNVDQYTYKVSLESGKTYSISYECNYNSGINFVYTQ